MIASQNTNSNRTPETMAYAVNEDKGILMNKFKLDWVKYT